jgi:hypothetical protein
MWRMPGHDTDVSLDILLPSIRRSTEPVFLPEHSCFWHWSYFYKDKLYLEMNLHIPVQHTSALFDTLPPVFVQRVQRSY